MGRTTPIIIEQSSKHIGIEHFGAHDLRRTCAKFCRKSGGDLEQIKFLLGHASIQTTERYLGSEQEIVGAVNDNLAAKPLYKGLGFTVKESDAAQAAKINLKTLAYFSASEK